jgi:ABC-type uncharacterized transport system substrate-binding protein
MRFAKPGEMARCRLGLALALLLGAAAHLSAHPVILITYRQDFSFDSGGLTGFSETWKFDQVHSEQILQMFDANHNGKIDPAEMPALQKGYFDDLKDYSYFTSIVLDGKPVATPDVTNFSAVFEDNRMIYHFFVPLRVAASAEEHELDITIWDPTYYTDLSVEGADALTLRKPASIDASVSVANDHRHFYNLAPGVTLVKPPPFFLKMIVVRFKEAG